MIEPRVSVVIPCFKQSEYVREAVLSVLEQNEGVEIIVVDDCNPDDESPQRVLTDLLGQVKVMRLPENRGLAGARNAGIAQASGELILPLDADDKLNSGAISVLRRALTVHNEADVAYGFLEQFGESIGRWGHVGGWPLRALLEENKLPYSSMFRKSAWERVGGYDEKMRQGFEDWEYWIRLAVTGSKFVCVNKTTLLYRRKSGSMYEQALKSYNAITSYIMAKHVDYYVRYGKMRRFIELPISWDAETREAMSHYGN